MERPPGRPDMEGQADAPAHDRPQRPEEDVRRGIDPYENLPHVGQDVPRDMAPQAPPDGGVAQLLRRHDVNAKSRRWTATGLLVDAEPRRLDQAEMPAYVSQRSRGERRRRILLGSTWPRAGRRSRMRSWAASVASVSRRWTAPWSRCSCES